MPAHPCVLVCIRTLVESLCPLKVGVQPPGFVAVVAVGARVVSRNGVRPFPRNNRRPRAAVEIAVASGFGVRRHAVLRGVFRHDVYRPQERRRAEHPSCRPLEHFDALDVADVHGEVEGVVSRLRVADVHAVEQHCDLLVVAAADADVGLRANRPALPHVHPCRVFEQVVDTLCRRLFDVLALQHSNHSGRLSVCQRSARACHPHLVERDAAACGDGVRLCRHGLHADAVGLGVGQGGHAECAYDDLLAKTGEQGVTLASEVLELHRRGGFPFVLVHRVFMKLMYVAFERLGKSTQKYE